MINSIVTWWSHFLERLLISTIPSTYWVLSLVWYIIKTSSLETNVEANYYQNICKGISMINCILGNVTWLVRWHSQWPKGNWHLSTGFILGCAGKCPSEWSLPYNQVVSLLNLPYYSIHIAGRCPWVTQQLKGFQKHWWSFNLLWHQNEHSGMMWKTAAFGIPRLLNWIMA